jgi:hypothetical protein
MLYAIFKIKRNYWNADFKQLNESFEKGLCSEDIFFQRFKNTLLVKFG